jgi:hypothetical protein
MALIFGMSGRLAGVTAEMGIWAASYQLGTSAQSGMHR